MKLTKDLILTTKKEEELACLLNIDINNQFNEKNLYLLRNFL